MFYRITRGQHENNLQKLSDAAAHAEAVEGTLEACERSTRSPTRPI